jgi:hypothetical protein
MNRTERANTLDFFSFLLVDALRRRDSVHHDGHGDHDDVFVTVVTAVVDLTPASTTRA